MKRLFALVLFIAIVGGATRIWYNRQLNPADTSDPVREVIQIPEGASAESIAELLEEKGLIRSAWAFKLYAKGRDLHTHLQAGSFVLMPSMSVPELLEALTGGGSGEVTVTIPEGYTVSNIDALIAEKGLAEPGEIERCARECKFEGIGFLPSSAELARRGGRLEGYLYPDTYFVSNAGFTAEAFLERLLKTFESRVMEDLDADIKASKRSLHEIVTMASLVEEETRTEEERPVVSGILWKRFDAGMGLDVDAAVRYIINKPTAAITRADLDTDSPYNLRKYRGLPPGPIASPSLSSIRATLKPEQTTYWYYLHGTDGRIRYAETNEQHNANRAKYL